MPDERWDETLRDVKSEIADLINSVYARVNSEPDSFSQKESANKTAKNPCTDTPCCVPPCDIFSIAGSIALLMYHNFNKCQLETLVNLLTLLVANLASLVTQIDINQGQEINPPF